MHASLGIAHASPAIAVSLLLCLGAGNGALADSPGDIASGQTPVPQESFLSSLKQSFNQDFDHQVVRGHFDVGSAPNMRRYYCLVDAKTGKWQPNGVPGQPFLRPDGMTGIKATSVSTYTCDSAEQQGILVTSAYVLNGNAKSVARAPQVQPQARPPQQRPEDAASAVAPPPPEPAPAPARVDVAGVKLGMSPEEVRATLKTRKLLNYFESMETLNPLDSAAAAGPPTAGGRFVNLIAAWTVPASAASSVAEGSESYEIMFTPVPGRERAMAIVHTIAYPPANGVREMALANGLVKKYGGFSGPGDLPASPTWRIQSSGDVQAGDSCGRRGLFGGLGAFDFGKAVRPNLALKTTPDEFRFQIDRCGMAIVTEDHVAADAAAAREERIITRFTVTAYSPSIAFEGATAASQLIQFTGAAAKANPARTKNVPVPDL